MTKNYKDKYLKYKNKYLQLKKIQKGGIPFCERAYENKLGTYWVATSYIKLDISL